MYFPFLTCCCLCNMQKLSTGPNELKYHSHLFSMILIFICAFMCDGPLFKSFHSLHHYLCIQLPRNLIQQDRALKEQQERDLRASVSLN